MKIRPLTGRDKAALLSMLIRSRAFTSQEIDVAMDLIDIVLKDQNQKDYKIHCLVNDQDQPLGYICYGPVPMTKGTHDLYWIVVDPESQRKGVGSRLVDFLEEVVRESDGRMILADTSTVPQYEKTRGFYLRKGFQEVARVPDYYFPGNDRVTFCKRL
ncbi:MAG TPA: GNAT family N-acetyltransferase [Thermodesulfobacteriota bacterium]|nr:GNAT family N-acetyltransferase [Thermodesulfobacteriota bacterium]